MDPIRIRPLAVCVVWRGADALVDLPRTEPEAATGAAAARG